MNTSELSQRVMVSGTSSYGHYKVEILYRGKWYKCTTNNSVAVDRHDDEDAKGPHCQRICTQKEALKTLWNECKRKNNLY